MKRFALAFAVVLSSVVAVGCNKPAEEDCKKAIENMRKLMGTDAYVTDIQPSIRRCRGGSSRDAVACAGAAKTRTELEACGFAKFDEAAPAAASGSGSGSAQ
ncbi:MAG: hypothetical protein H0V17_28245 [Deltaproteobacteria bacterium]|nr:hypothetical protein [Deltaproteobacteria bacterium]